VKPRPARWSVLVLCWIALTGCTVLSGLPGASPGAAPLPPPRTPPAVVADQPVARPLEFRPVTAERSGSCDSRATNAVTVARDSVCLILGPSALTVRRPESVGYRKASLGQWVVDVTLDSSDTRVFAEITGRLAGLPPPRNELAIMIGDPPDGELLGAPAVQEKITVGTVELGTSGGKQGARALADRVRGR
jgi:preprotein translocase subunit SecD